MMRKATEIGWISVRGMRLVLIDKRTRIALAISAVLPMLPVILYATLPAGLIRLSKNAWLTQVLPNVRKIKT
jgi:hypothetical protein